MYFMGNYAQTVNVIGCIKTTKTEAAFAATGLALALYRKQFGVVPVATEGGQPLDVMAALSEDGKALTVAVINPTLEPLDVPLEVKGVDLTGTGRVWEIGGSDPMAYNEPGKQPKVRIEEAPLEGISESLRVGPCSVSIYALGVK
jgi:alpha-N-arabinofuranosidase